MRKLLLIVALLFSVTAFSQEKIKVDTYLDRTEKVSAIDKLMTMEYDAHMIHDMLDGIVYASFSYDYETFSVDYEVTFFIDDKPFAYIIDFNVQCETDDWVEMKNLIMMDIYALMDNIDKALR